MPIDVSLQRAKLTLAFEVYARNARKPLRDWIVAEIQTLDNRSGQRVTITSGNGQYVAFDSSADGLRSPSDLMVFWADMLALYDTAKAALISSGNATPTEAQIVAEMLSRLRPVRSATADFSSVLHDCEEVPS